MKKISVKGVKNITIIFSLLIIYSISGVSKSDRNLDFFSINENIKYVFKTPFGKSVITLQTGENKFEYNYYNERSNISKDWAEGTYKRKGKRLILKVTSERKFLKKSKLYFSVTENEIIEKRKGKFYVYLKQ